MIEQVEVMQSVYTNVLTHVMTPCNDSHMNTNTITEVRFTARRASYWNTGNMRWQAIARDKAEALVALGQATDLTGRSL